MPSGQQTKLLWKNPDYRKKMSGYCLGKKYPEHSKRMMGNKNAFKNKVIKGFCVVCGKEIYYFKSQIKKTCSKECLKEVKRKQMINNKFAVGYKMTKIRKTKIAEFISKTRNQENNPNWKGGTKRQYKILYGSKMYKEWRNCVFERDKFICQDCGIKSGNGKKVYLEAHHIKEWAKYPKLRFEISNGITLCKKCHNKTKVGRYITEKLSDLKK